MGKWLATKRLVVFLSCFSVIGNLREQELQIENIQIRTTTSTHNPDRKTINPMQPRLSVCRYGKQKHLATTFRYANTEIAFMNNLIEFHSVYSICAGICSMAYKGQSKKIPNNSYHQQMSLALTMPTNSAFHQPTIDRSK